MNALCTIFAGGGSIRATDTSYTVSLRFHLACLLRRDPFEYSTIFYLALFSWICQVPHAFLFLFVRLLSRQATGATCIYLLLSSLQGLSWGRSKPEFHLTFVRDSKS